MGCNCLVLKYQSALWHLSMSAKSFNPSFFGSKINHMKKLVSKYGLITSGIIVGVSILSAMIFEMDANSFAIAEVIGYVSMILALSTVFFAMRQQKITKEGKLSFGEGLKLGTMISAVGSLAFAIYNALFVTIIMPDFNEQYFAYQTGLELGSAELEKQFAIAKKENPLFFSVVGGSILMFVTVFILGFIESVISALVLQKQ